MSIEAIQTVQTLHSADNEAISKVAKAEDAHLFIQRLLAGNGINPEHAVIKGLQETQNTLMSGVHSLPDVNSPTKMLAVQSQLAGSTIGVDIVAKVAGSFATAVNKLVSMQ